MPIGKLLIANRGEIAVRIARTAAELGIATVAVHARDDATGLHVHAADRAVALAGDGVAAYLDIEGVVQAARDSGCDALHPGYGFLSENADFASACVDAGLVFVGPRPEVLALFGDKARARALAAELGVPLLPGTQGPTTAEEARAFLAGLGPGGAVMVKALAGGGGRGLRAVDRVEDVEEAVARCRSEAQATFGRPDVYVERLVRRARHVEVQMAGDGSGAAVHLWERDCTLQRRHQKLVEMAPAFALAPDLRERLLATAVTMAAAARYDNLGTFEFLVDRDAPGSFAFMEANPRLQVEHTVTEEVTGLDLVALQLRLAAGATLADLGLTQDRVPAPRGIAVQVRINAEAMQADGSVRPTGGTLIAWEPPSGPGIRVDGAGYSGWRFHPGFDSLLAKLIVHVPDGDFPRALHRAGRALGEFRMEGVASNAGFLRALLARPEVAAGEADTGFVEAHAAALLEAAAALPAPRTAAPGAAAATPRASVALPPGTEGVPAPVPGTVVGLDVAAGAVVRKGQQLAVLEAMKMEFVVASPVAGTVRAVFAVARATVAEGEPLLAIEPGAEDRADGTDRQDTDLDAIRPDLAAVLARRVALSDAARPEAVARRRRTGQRTARENMAALFDGGDWLEYGAFVLAAQHSRRTREELERMSPADGLLAGIGQINADAFDETRSRAMAMAYDFTVFAGTQGYHNHVKKDRLIEIARKSRLPLVLFAEGGGGRPGDTDWPLATGLTTRTFYNFAALSALVPLVGVVSGRCFAGNAALLGVMDVIISTPDANIGMGGPAMIEGGGLGVYRPEEVGPVSVQAPNGVIDLLVADETEAAAAARRYLGYFQGRLPHWDSADQRRMRQLVPENRLRAYDIRTVIETLADTGSVMELRRDFGIGIITALVRVEGRPVGLIANNPLHLGGAIDAPAADKAARFMQLCDAFDIPLLSLCDTPGFMVGPEIEKTAQVRHVSRMFAIGASLDVPFLAVVLRKGYGLGAQAMVAGGFHEPVMMVAWPTGEFGPMGLEGAVRLGYRRELEAIADPADRKKYFEEMVAKSYAAGTALNVASKVELDSVIDPKDTRDWVARVLRAMPPVPARTGKKRPCIDSW